MPVSVPSYNQLLGAMMRKFMAVTGVNDMHKGSVIATLLEAAAQNDFSQFGALIQLLDDSSVDNATGADLAALALQYGITNAPLPAQTASGYVTFGDSTVTAVSTNVYIGSNLPIAGDLVIKVNSIAGFSNGAKLYIGTGTPNNEGPFTIASVTPGVAFGTITITTPLANNHNANEVVLLAQGGNRTIPKGTNVQVPQSNTAPAVLYVTSVDAVIADGESQVQNILVTATSPGSAGNAALGAISQFTTVPFSGATVTNPTSFSNGADIETDDQLRDRIKNTIQSLSNGVPQAILTAITGLFSPTDNKTVVSANLIQPTAPGDVGTLFVDDGTGFEPGYAGQGEEDLIDNASGGEAYFQIGNFPIIRPQVTTTLSQPYDLSVGGTLTVRVNGVATSVNLDPATFPNPSGATAIQIAEAINAASATTNFSARTADGLTQVVVFASGEMDETIQVEAGGVNDVLGFPTSKVTALLLYKNNQLLTEDGITASAASANIDSWASPPDPSVITLAINGKPTVWIKVASGALYVSYDGTNYAQLVGVTTFLSLGVTITTASVPQWALVLNQAVSGATFSADNDTLVLTSDIPDSTASTIQVVPVSAGGGNLATVQGWDTTLHVGVPSEYSLNRFSGQLKLATPLLEGDSNGG